MDLSIFSWIFTLALAGMKDVHCNEIPCEKFEVMVCGDANSPFSICQPKTPGVRRILSAQLDIRYANRYCRRYGMPENFGLTASGRSMWTVRWCYGTFFLCLELDSDISYESLGEDYSFGIRSSMAYGISSMSYDSTISHISDQTTVETTTESVPSIDDSETTEVNYNADFVVETGPAETDEYFPNEEYFENSRLQTDNSSSNTNHDKKDNNHGLDPRLKFWVMFAIVGGGIIIVILIAMIAYLTIQCCDSNTEESVIAKPKKSSGKKYFRPQKWSTSALVTSEPEYCTDVYDFIPASKIKHTTSIKTEYETSDKQSNKQADEKICEKVKPKVDDKPESHDGSLSKNNSSKRNDYFILIPQTLDDGSLNSENNGGHQNAHLNENVYDHLVHTPTISILDASTYHHLNFKRDTECENVITNSQHKVNNQNDTTHEENSAISDHKLNFKSDTTHDDMNAKSDHNLNCQSDTTHGEVNAKSDQNLIGKSDTTTGEINAKSDHNLNFKSETTHNEINAKSEGNLYYHKD